VCHLLISYQLSLHVVHITACPSVCLSTVNTDWRCCCCWWWWWWWWRLFTRVYLVIYSTYLSAKPRDSRYIVVMTTATAARSLADDDVNKMMSEGTSAGDITELTESERDFRLKTEDQLNCDDEEQRRLDELLTQCHDYIYSQGHMTSSKIITNGSLTSRTPLSPRDVTSGVMAACWLELPVSSSRDAFPFPNNDVVNHADVTSHIYRHDDVSTARTTFFYYYCYYYTTTTTTTTTTICQLVDESRWKAKCLTPGNPCPGATRTRVFFRRYVSPILNL